MYCVAGVLGVQYGLDYEIGAYAYAILSTSLALLAQTSWSVNVYVILSMVFVY